MLRRIGGVLLGYVVMAGFVFLTFTAFYLAVGSDVAFKPSVYDVSAAWVAGSFVLSTVAAVLGGVVCQLIAGCRQTVGVLAGIVFALGVLFAIPAVFAEQNTSELSPARTGDVPNMEAMMKAKTPAWIAVCNPFVGAIGVLIGGKLARGRSKSHPPLA